MELYNDGYDNNKDNDKDEGEGGGGQMPINRMKGSIVAMSNCHINAAAVAEEFCLAYEPLPEQSAKKKTRFIVRGEERNRKAFIAAIKERLETQSPHTTSH